MLDGGKRLLETSQLVFQFHTIWKERSTSQGDKYLRVMCAFKECLPSPGKNHLPLKGSRALSPSPCPPAEGQVALCTGSFPAFLIKGHTGVGSGAEAHSCRGNSDTPYPSFKG